MLLPSAALLGLAVNITAASFKTVSYTHLAEGLLDDVQSPLQGLMLDVVARLGQCVRLLLGLFDLLD